MTVHTAKSAQKRRASISPLKKWHMDFLNIIDKDVLEDYCLVPEFREETLILEWKGLPKQPASFEKEGLTDTFT